MEYNFLSLLSEKIISLNIPLEETVIVLPNRRAHRMLLKELVRRSDRPIFAPSVFTIEEFVDFLSPLRKMEQLELLTELFRIYQTYGTQDAADFDAFLSWGPAFLDDVSDMDVQMQNCVSIFKDLATAKSFEIAFGQDDVSEGQRKTIKFYELLSDLYEKFVEELLQKKCGYVGLLYRDCANNVQNFAEKLTAKHFVFAGFHVLSVSELQIIRYLKDHFDTHFFFDVDRFYCDFQKESHFTTAYFLKKICDELSILPEKIQFSNHYFEETEKEIQIAGTPKSMNQIYYAINQLERIREEQGGHLNDTALVLADESLLLPFLSAYHPDDMNVTMGYPIKATPAYTLLTTLLEMYQTGLRSSQIKAADEPMSFYHRDIIALMRNPLVKEYLFTGDRNVDDSIQEYDDRQSFQFQLQDIEAFELPHYTRNTKRMLRETIDYLNVILSKAEQSNHAEMLSVMVEKLQETADFLQPLIDNGTELSFSVIKYAIGQQIDKLTLSMKGDASQGLQVMGLLETRTLDFKNVIMLSVNEGTLPSGIQYNSLLPFDFKYEGQALENYLYKDQVYAYHFFRLLQRASNIILIFNNDTIGSLSEKSRFVTQLEFEVTDKNLSNIHLTYPIVSFPFLVGTNNEITVQKTDAIQDEILNFSFSATSVNDYISCPLMFYLKNICGIRKRDTFNDKIENNVIGTVTHGIFEDVFNEVKKQQTAGKSFADYKVIFDDYIDNVEIKVEEKLKKDENLRLSSNDLLFGRIFLASKIIQHDVRNYLTRAKSELSGDVVRIVGNEDRRYVDLEVDGKAMHLKGSIDRLQKMGDVWEIVDYKTGRVYADNLSIVVEDDSSKENILKSETMKQLFEDTKYHQLVQLLIYAVLWKHSYSKDKDQKVKSGLLSITEVNKKSDNYFFPVTFGMSKDDLSDELPMLLVDAFEQKLQKLLMDIYSTEKPFKQCADSSRCVYCDFKFICCR